MNSASALIIWKNKILLFHRDNITTIKNPDCWSLPGGVIEKDESPLQGLMRELQEEVSYIPKNIKHIKTFRTLNKSSYVYIAKVSDSETKCFKHGPGEGQGIGWFSYEEAVKLKLTPKLRFYLMKHKNKIFAI